MRAESGSIRTTHCQSVALSCSRDDNYRKPICRLWFKASQKYLGLLDDEKNETRHAIERPADIYRFADELRQSASKYVET